MSEHVIAEAREARAHAMVEAADDVRDMGQRVVGNGPEIVYGREKLDLALFKAAEGLTLTGASEDDVVRAARRGWRHGRWIGWGETHS